MALCKLLLLFALFVAVFADETPVEDEEQSLETRNYPQLRRRVVVLEAKLRKILTHQAWLIRGTNGRDGAPGKNGRDGRDGRGGAPGPKGPKGPRGATGRGIPGPSGGGVEYVRWGRTTCPSGAHLVYKGRVGGELYTHKGGGVNYLCMTEQPKYLKFLDGFQASGRLYGAEYEVHQYARGRTLFGKHLHNDDAVCAVCHVTTRSAKLMIPGTYMCPAGWKREYFGYLMTEYYNHPHPRDFICVDNRARGVPGSRHDRNGALMYPVEGTCGSLPCGPYVNARELTCAVCTK